MNRFQICEAQRFNLCDVAVPFVKAAFAQQEFGYLFVHKRLDVGADRVDDALLFIVESQYRLLGKIILTGFFGGGAALRREGGKLAVEIIALIAASSVYRSPGRPQVKSSRPSSEYIQSM